MLLNRCSFSIRDDPFRCNYFHTLLRIAPRILLSFFFFLFFSLKKNRSSRATIRQVPRSGSQARRLSGQIRPRHRFRTRRRPVRPAQLTGRPLTPVGISRTRRNQKAMKIGKAPPEKVATTTTPHHQVTLVSANIDDHRDKGPLLRGSQATTTPNNRLSERSMSSVTKFAVCGVLNAERVTRPSVVRNGKPRCGLSLTTSTGCGEQRLGELGFPEVTAAYRQLRDVRKVEWKKNWPAFSKWLACNRATQGTTSSSMCDFYCPSDPDD